MGKYKQTRSIAVIGILLIFAACARAPIGQGRGDGLADTSAPAAGGAPGGVGGAGAPPPSQLPESFDSPPADAQPEIQDPAVKGKTFTPLADTPPSKDYLQVFTPSGRPRFQFDSRLNKEFGARLGHAEALSSKGERVFAELQRVANREAPTERSLLIMPADAAEKWSQELERSGHSPQSGAWSIAVQQTAVRHHFPSVPCAEFVSEVLREAYSRAEVDINDDFGSQRANRLIWSETASVAGLKRALLKAGWVPWNAHEFVPPVGAIMMNGTGETPGHAFLAAGHSGRFIVDNGAPAGRDLGTTGLRILKEMYSAGVFFLPPGINPTRWR